MIDIKHAISQAKAFARDVLGQEDLLLEEVSSDDDGFDITLSMPRRAGAPRVRMVVPLRYSDEREFKTFRVSKADGAVTKMSIREIA